MSWPWAVQAADRQLFMSVMSQSGQPVLGLTGADVRLEQAGVECAVTSVEPDTDKMKIALMVDASGPAANSVNPLRAGLRDFLDTLPPQHEVGLFTITGQTRRRVDFTTDRDEFREEVANLFGESNTGAALLDGLLETWNRRFDDEDPWPVFVLVIHDGPEASRSVQDREFNQFVAEPRGATVHAVLVSTRGGGLQSQVSINLTRNTGGIYNAIAAATGLSRALTDLATAMGEHHNQVKDRYRVLYECDPADSADRITVSVVTASGQAVAVGLYFDRRVER